MEENKGSITTLFKKMAERKCTPEERLQLLTYLENATSPEELPSVEDLAVTGTVMPATAAEKVFLAILEYAPPKQVIPLWKKTGFRIAAALIPLAVVITMAVLWYRERDNRRHFVNNTRHVKTIQLEDGTVISLNQHSQLIAGKSFTTGKQREVWLEGEAFFTVNHQASQPFVVHAPHDIHIYVLGTAFNVNTANTHTRVVLNAGSVHVKAGTHQQAIFLLLKPGEMADFNAETGVLSRQYIDTLFQTSWKYNLLAFKTEPLKNVMQQLSEQYDCDVAFKDASLENLLFTGYLPTDNLQQAILTVAQSFNVNIFLQHKTIYVNKKIL